MHILYLTAEQWPTFRADVTTLFGKYLPRFGITCDLVTEQEVGTQNAANWPAGKAILCKVTKSRAGQYVLKFLHQAKTLITADYAQYQAVQVRDMTLIALVAIVMCKLKKRPFFYWLSYPQSEGQISRAKARGASAGMRYWFPLLQGNIGKFLLYKIILSNANHVFVQSQNMLEMLALQGVSPIKMTAIPMGVDLETAVPQKIQISDDAKLLDKRVLVYLGTLDQSRQIPILFEMLVMLRQQMPDILLVLAGDTEDATHREWLKQEAQRLNVMQHILWTGWLPMYEAWRYVMSAEIGLSPFPRGYLLDMASPTKAIEYMALGLPIIANDNPDQMQVLQESSAGICVKLNASNFAHAVLGLINDEVQKNNMAQQGLAYVRKVRAYDILAEKLAAQYRQLQH
ncbi:MAG: glycosyltransferase [Methylotenera sp.]|nr:glycosyltransferase [Methylotenera sp.]